MRSDQEYWMSLEAEQLADRLISRHDLSYQTSNNPVYDMVVRNTYAYYSTMLDAESYMTSLNFAGEQGELVKMSVPQARGLVRALLTLLTKQKLAFNAIALIKDSDVQEQVRIANALSRQVSKDQNLDKKRAKLVERCLVQGTSFIKTSWRSDMGMPRIVQETEDGDEQVLYEGDVEISTPSFFDLHYDHTVEDWEDLDWAEARVKRNRWSLIAQHPELKQEIMNLPGCSEDLTNIDGDSNQDRDKVYVWEMYHKPCPALPQGRMLIYASTKCIFYDDINKYGKIPIEQLKPEPIEGVGCGYAMLSNLLPSQEMFDHSMSCIATNQSALGVQNILSPNGSNIQVRELHGMNFIDYDPQNIPGGGKPEKLDLLNTAPEVNKFSEVLLGHMQQMSGINAAVRGELPASTSGVAIATLTTNALEFLWAYSLDIMSCMENTIMNSITSYKKFARTERLVRITGKNFKTTAKEFQGSDLDPIVSIEMQEVNPLMQTIAGRLDIAEKSLDKGLVKDMQAYVSILDGQPLSVITEGEQSENDLIMSENERLAEGQTVIPMSIDKHALHIYRHKSLLDDPEIRNNSPLAQQIQQHILDHLKLARETDPMLAAMAATGTMPEMPPQPPPMQGGGPPIEAENQMGAPPDMALPTAEQAQPADDLLGRDI